MRQVKLAVAVFATYLVLVVGISTLSPGRAHSQSPPPTFNVKVSNTPLPVTGNVNATVTGAVNASQSGTWTVGVSSLPAVQLAAGSKIGQDGNWAVAISGTPSVNVANTPSVSTGLDTKVDTANDHLAAIEGQASNLNFDGQSLKVSLQGSPSLSVSGGTITAARPVATRAPRMGFQLGIAGGHAEFPVNPAVYATGIMVGASHSFDVKLLVMANDANGNSVQHEIGWFGVNNGTVITFPQRLQVVGVNVRNTDLIAEVGANISLIGDNQP